MPEFEHLPFNERPDLSPYLVHLTKNTKKEDEYSAFDNLVSLPYTFNQPKLKQKEWVNQD